MGVLVVRKERQGKGREGGFGFLFLLSLQHTWPVHITITERIIGGIVENGMGRKGKWGWGCLFITRICFNKHDFVLFFLFFFVFLLLSFLAALGAWVGIDGSWGVEGRKEGRGVGVYTFLSSTLQSRHRYQYVYRLRFSVSLFIGFIGDLVASYELGHGMKLFVRFRSVFPVGGGKGAGWLVALPFWGVSVFPLLGEND